MPRYSQDTALVFVRVLRVKAVKTIDIFVYISEVSTLNYSECTNVRTYVRLSSV